MIDTNVWIAQKSTWLCLTLLITFIAFISTIQKPLWNTPTSQIAQVLKCKQPTDRKNQPVDVTKMLQKSNSSSYHLPKLKSRIVGSRSRDFNQIIRKAKPWTNKKIKQVEVHHKRLLGPLSENLIFGISRNLVLKVEFEKGNAGKTGRSGEIRSVYATVVQITYVPSEIACNDLLMAT